ncbi:MAG: hypothetical protein OEX08_01285 [Candidatus Nomurabacteria bacterium]|nr:hypothetical protein [Candidatus Nomurabacteria bacterium]
MKKYKIKPNLEMVVSSLFIFIVNMGAVISINSYDIKYLVLGFGISITCLILSIMGGSIVEEID